MKRTLSLLLKRARKFLNRRVGLLGREEFPTFDLCLCFNERAAKGDALMLGHNGFADRLINVRKLAGANVFLNGFSEVGRKCFDDGSLGHWVQCTKTPPNWSRNGLWSQIVCALTTCGMLG